MAGSQRANILLNALLLCHLDTNLVLQLQLANTENEFAQFCESIDIFIKKENTKAKNPSPYHLN